MVRDKKTLGKVQGKLVVGVKITTSLRLGDLRCHGYNNKHVIKNMERSWSCFKKQHWLLVGYRKWTAVFDVKV